MTIREHHTHVGAKGRDLLLRRVSTGRATPLLLPANMPVICSALQGGVHGWPGLLVALIVGPQQQLLHPKHPAALGPLGQLHCPRWHGQDTAAPVHHSALLLFHEFSARRGRNPHHQLVPALQILLSLLAVPHQLPGAAPPAEQVRLTAHTDTAISLL